MNEDISEALTNFYSLKSAYEKSITGKGVKKCIVCKKNGGSIFKRDKQKLIAICGAISPCNFNIEIDRGSSDQLRDLMSITNDEYKDVRKDIIESKLFHMYHNSDISDIDDTISTYTTLSNYRDTLYELFNDVIYNRKNLGTIKEKEGETIELLTSMKEKLSGSNPIIPEVVELYISTLLPHLEKIRELKYKHNEVVHIRSEREHPLYNDDNMALVQRRYDIESMEITSIEPRLISNVTTK